MKKILIVSYFFPPCNLTASQRAFSWAKYLSGFGYHPIVITRRWDEKINTLSDISRSTAQEVLHETKEGYEVYYLPYRSNLRDLLFVKYGDKKFSGLRKTLTFFELLLQHFFPFVIPYKNIFCFAQNIAKKDPEIKLAIISGNPFNLFRLGYQLNNKYGVKWIADYRDAWTTSEINFINRSKIFRIINVLDGYFEKKWCSNASVITASSLPIAEGVSGITGVKGCALYNGFVKEDFEGISVAKFEDFTVTYVGTLYDGQKVEIFCEAFRQLIDSEINARVKLLFPGLAFDAEQRARIDRVMKSYEKYYECTPRMDRHKVLTIEKQSHLLLHVAWDEQKGIIASKIYEYIASGSFALVVPSDRGSIQEIVEKSGSGICLSTVPEVFEFLKQEYKNYLQGKFRIIDTNMPSVLQFSRQNQVKVLAALLDQI